MFTAARKNRRYNNNGWQQTQNHLIPFPSPFNPSLNQKMSDACAHILINKQTWKYDKQINKMQQRRPDNDKIL